MSEFASALSAFESVTDSAALVSPPRYPAAAKKRDEMKARA